MRMQKPHYTWQEITLIALCVIIGTAFIYYLWGQKARSVRADLVMNGDIRGNTRTHTFHVPGCPQYNSMNAENIRTFPTIGDAEDAQYDPSRNCLEDINLRRSIEDGDGEDGSPGGMEDPRQ